MVHKFGVSIPPGAAPHVPLESTQPPAQQTTCRCMDLQFGASRGGLFHTQERSSLRAGQGQAYPAAEFRPPAAPLEHDPSSGETETVQPFTLHDDASAVVGIDQGCQPATHIGRTLQRCAGNRILQENFGLDEAVSSGVWDLIETISTLSHTEWVRRWWPSAVIVPRAGCVSSRGRLPPPDSDLPTVPGLREARPMDPLPDRRTRLTRSVSESHPDSQLMPITI